MSDLLKRLQERLDSMTQEELNQEWEELWKYNDHCKDLKNK